MPHTFTEIRDSANRVQSTGGWSALAGLFSKWGGAQLPIDMLLLKAAAIQLAEDSHGLSLADAKAALDTACDLDAGGIQAEIEIGHFLFSVGDAAQASLPHFEAALVRSDASYIEALCGMAHAVNELRGIDAAIELLRHSRAAQTDRVRQLIAELLAGGSPDGQA